MLLNYIKIALRTLMRDRLYTLISIAGLAIGIACCLLIALYVGHEWSFDRFHADSERIYRVIRMEDGGDGFSGVGASTSNRLAPEIRLAAPTAETVTRVLSTGAVVRVGTTSFPQRIVQVDPDFFRTFSFPAVRGDLNTALARPDNIVLSATMADKYFPDVDPIGQSIILILGGEPVTFQVSAVLADPPANSSIQYDLIASIEVAPRSIPEDQLNSWSNIFMSTFVRLRPGADAAAFATTVTDHVNAVASAEELGYRLAYATEPLTGIHLNPDLGGLMVPSTDPVYSYILAGIAAMVLLIACINFTTLAVARSTRRVREVGLRKVLGAHRRQIMSQFWGEPLLLSGAAILLGIILTQLALPVFNDLAGKRLTLNAGDAPTLVPVLLALWLSTAFLSGLYPSLLLSRLYPASTLTGHASLARRTRLIPALVVLQFVIAIFLLISTGIITAQLDYIADRDLGFDEGLVVTIPTGTSGAASERLVGRYRQALADRPEVLGVSGYAYAMGNSWLWVKDEEEEGMTVLIGEDVTGKGYGAGYTAPKPYYYVNWVDAHYLDVMGIELVAGRGFSPERGDLPEQAVIVNETLVKAMGWDNPIGARLDKGIFETEVIGVVKDFHYYPLHREIDPLVLHAPGSRPITTVRHIAVRIRGGAVPATLGMLEETWHGLAEGLPFSYDFLDDDIAAQYAAERRWERIVRYAFALSILITCLGLFGLTSLAVARRTREVGIRKVLGASVASIVTLFSKDFVTLVGIAFLVAAPSAGLVMHHWLEDFAYRTALSPWLFAGAGLLALAITVATVSVQAIQAGLVNPARSLRQE